MSIFSNKVVVITGGSSGIGEAIADAFNEQGPKIALLGRDTFRLEKVHKRLKKAIFIQGDITNLRDIECLYKETESKLGRVEYSLAMMEFRKEKVLNRLTSNFLMQLLIQITKGFSLPYKDLFLI